MSGLSTRTRAPKQGEERVRRSPDVQRDEAITASGPAALQALIAGRGTTGGAVALQRLAGNRATTALLRPKPTVQRETDLEEGVDKSGGTLDTVSGQVGQWGGLGGGLGQLPNQSGQMDTAYKYGNTTSPGAQAGEAGGIIGGLAGVGSTILNAKNSIESRNVMNEEREGGREGEAKFREAKRTNNTSTVNSVQSGVGISGQVMGTLSGFSQVAANSGSTSAFAGMNNLLGGIGGIIALPITALSTLRTMRKAAKQYARVKKLREDLADPSVDASKAKKRLALLDTQIDETQALYDSAVSDSDEAEQDLKARFPKRPGSKSSRRALYDQMAQDVADKKAITDGFKTTIDDAKEERRQVQEAQDKAIEEIRLAKERQEHEVETPDDIRAYAMKKNQSGFMKKIVNVVGGVIGIGGGIAATIASFAAIGATAVVSTAVIATPVGWALCGAAALVGLAMGGYAFWKWASKRFGRARKANKSKLQSFLHAINPFSKKIGVSRRERLAERLYNFARKGTDEEKTKAKSTIQALGLDWAGLKMGKRRNKDSSIRLITAKMGS